MYKKLFFIFFTLLVPIFLFAQQDNPVVFKINGQPVYWSEIKQAYDKGNEYAEEKESVSDFIRSYADFKRNIEEARAQGIDTTISYRRSYESFKNQMADSYMIRDTVYETEYLRKIYDRLLENVEINHIVIPFGKELVLPSDTLIAYEKASEVRARILKKGFGLEEFRTNGITPLMTKPEDRNGYIGWVTAFMLPYIVENAIYSLPLNEISQPIRSHKGYHIVQVLKRRPAAGSVEIEQVMFNFPTIPPTQHQIDSVGAVAQREYNNIHSTEDFNVLCEEFSIAHQTGEQGCYFGILGLDSTLPAEFTTAAFNLNNPGDVSKPVMSTYAFHILRLLRKIPVPGFETLKNQLKEKITRSDKAQELSDGSRRALMANLNMEINGKAYAKLEAITNTLSPRDSAFIKEVDNGEEILISIDGKRSYKVKEFTRYIKMRQNALKSNPDELQIFRIEEATRYSLSSEILKEYFDAFTIFLVKDFEKYTLEERNPGFRKVMEEYSDGILLFEVKDRNIWSRARNDEKGLAEFFAKNKAKYTLDGTKYKGMIVYAKSEKDLEKAKSISRGITSKDTYIEEIRKTLNKDSVTIKIEPGLWTKGNNPYIDHEVFDGEKPVVQDKRFPYYFVSGKFINKPEDLSDVKSAVEADYQEKLEKDWTAYIRKKYNVEFNEPVVRKLE